MTAKQRYYVADGELVEVEGLKNFRISSCSTEAVVTNYGTRVCVNVSLSYSASDSTTRVLIESLEGAG